MRADLIPACAGNTDRGIRYRGGVLFPDVNVGLRPGQSVCPGRRVPITLSDPPAHPERCRDALRKTHEKHQHRIDPTIERRRVSESV
mgnify:CR=1 FL=1